MSKKLAIKGHPTRGNEVIELFKMMGGCECGYDGGGTGFYYYISQFGNIEASCKPTEFDTYIVYTLEEFLEKFPYKVGDKVVDRYGDTLTIKSMSWSEDWETMVYDFEDAVIVLTAEDLKPVDDEDDDNTEPTKMKNVLAELLEHIKTTPKDELEREFEEIKKWSNIGPSIEEFMTFCESVNKKPTYPATYEECCEIIHSDPNFYINTHLYSGTLETLYKLLICRDAYWKIAGEQMGLDNPWKPDWSTSKPKYVLACTCNGTEKQWETTYCKTFAFPSAEMRDTFYENFKDLIEQCKELL